MKYAATLITCIFFSLSLSRPAFAQFATSKKIEAVRVTEPITIDGKLSESVWHRPGFTDFKQREPNQGQPASERTEVWVAYDDEALYVAARLYDGAPDSIMRILGRRDAFVTADWFGFFIDPYYDRRSGFSFAISAGGTLVDGVLYNDDWDDESWDGVWEGKANIDSEGWTVEMRIPFSQLRFHQQEKYLWAVNFRRDIGRKNEIDYAVYTPRNESGFVSRFIDLVGIENIVPPHQVELLPYFRTRAEYTNHHSDDPFNNGSKYIPGLGVDLKVGLSSNLTLDATVNPDFGQVEVDPAIVNLSDVESFFQEKRPFFIEGASIFNFGTGGANSYWDFNFPFVNNFYSRRIGRNPRGSIPTADFVDAPVGTHILGAGKVTGKLGGGWNIGTIHALTAREYAELETNGVRSRAEIEPLAYHGIFRGQKEFNEGRQALGIMSTLAARKFSDDRLRDEINSDALFTGVDGYTFLDSEKMWVITGWAGLSHVAGNQTRMIQLQRNSQHYFQRPDANHVHVDSSATSLTGYAMRVWLNKQKGNIFVNAAFGVIDPKFEVNDLGFLGRTDVINMHAAASYRWTEPGEVFRYAQLGGAIFRNYDFGGNLTWAGVSHFGDVQFLNYFKVYWDFAYGSEVVNNTRTRGGPLTLTPPEKQFDFGINTDSRKAVVLNFFTITFQGRAEKYLSTKWTIEWKPAPNVNFQFGPNFSKDLTEAQWVGAFSDPTAVSTFGNRYVFAELHQTTLGANIRLNWTFTPQLSFQLFAQPLISAGAYTNFKELARPKSFDFNVYGTGTSTISKSSDSYQVDPDGDGPAAPFTFSNPDFNFKSLRGNVVLRWEYHPGSTLYLVWTQSRSDVENDGIFQFTHSISRLLNAKPDNIFMVKLTYWLSK